MADHTEAIQVVYDPDVVSYSSLLTSFWSQHRPREPAWSRQYRSAVFVADDAERLAATRARDVHARQGAVYTDIETAGPFTPAETYHQKYRLQRSDILMAELRRFYPGEDGFVGSTVAMRLNAWLAGEPVDPDELRQTGLSQRGLAALRAELDG